MSAFLRLHSVSSACLFAFSHSTELEMSSPFSLTFLLSFLSSPAIIWRSFIPEIILFFNNISPERQYFHPFYFLLPPFSPPPLPFWCFFPLLHSFGFLSSHYQLWWVTVPVLSGSFRCWLKSILWWDAQRWAGKMPCAASILQWEDYFGWTYCTKRAFIFSISVSVVFIWLSLLILLLYPCWCALRHSFILSLPINVKIWMLHWLS